MCTAVHHVRTTIRPMVPPPSVRDQHHHLLLMSLLLLQSSCCNSSGNPGSLSQLGHSTIGTGSSGAFGSSSSGSGHTLGLPLPLVLEELEDRLDAHDKGVIPHDSGDA